MLWDLLVGCTLFAIFLMYYVMAKKVDALQKDVDDCLSMMRVFRYRELQRYKDGDS